VPLGNCRRGSAVNYLGPNCWLLLFVIAACVGVPAKDEAEKKRVLILTETQGFRHSSIPEAVGVVRMLGVETGQWQVTQVADTPEQVQTAIAAGNLATVDLVVFANTTGDLSFRSEGREAFYEWVRGGGSYVGIHSASDTFHGDSAYLDLVRGEFLTHGPQTQVTVFVQDTAHAATSELPDLFEIFDEIYEFQNWSRDSVHVLLTLHAHPQSGALGDFPISWSNRLGEGRMFYTALGHRKDIYTNPVFVEHLRGGILWALGLGQGNDGKGNPIR
jgi:hypothetical protein